MACPKPGDFITAQCRRCSDVTGHVVMLVIGGEVAKVECRACGSVHKYRETNVPKRKDPSDSPVRHVRAGLGRDAATDLGNRPATRSSNTSSAAARSQATKKESAWQEAMVRHGAETPVPYSMKMELRKGAFVEHSVFGRGEVVSVAKPDKAEILFREGVKLLRCVVP